MTRKVDDRRGSVARTLTSEYHDISIIREFEGGGTINMPSLWSMRNVDLRTFVSSTAPLTRQRRFDTDANGSLVISSSTLCTET